MDLPAAPEKMRTQWRVEDEELVLDLPPAGFSLAAFGPILAVNIALGMMGAGAFACFVMFVALRPDVAPSLKWIIGVPFGLLCFTLPDMILFQGIVWPAHRRTRVSASWRGLRVERRLAFIRQVKQIGAEEIEELAVTRIRVPAITARGGKAAIRFGEGLPEAELEWLRAALVKALGK